MIDNMEKLISLYQKRIKWHREQIEAKTSNVIDLQKRIAKNYKEQNIEKMLKTAGQVMSNTTITAEHQGAIKELEILIVCTKATTYGKKDNI